MTEEPVVPEAAAENTAAASGNAPAAGEHEASDTTTRDTTSENEAPDNESPDTTPRSPRRRGNRRAVSSGPGGAAGLLPVTAKEDDPRMWGDSPEDSDSWLREQRPPHWE